MSKIYGMSDAVEKDKVGKWDGSVCMREGAGGGGQGRLSEKRLSSKDLKEVREEATQMSGE